MSKEQNKKQGPLGPKERWSSRRKREVVLRLLRGEPLDALSRELGVEIYRLEQWREKALQGIDEAMRDRTGDPLQTELDTAKRHIGELSMENELLRRERDLRRPLPGKRSWK
jgi:transposase